MGASTGKTHEYGGAAPVSMMNHPPATATARTSGLHFPLSLSPRHLHCQIVDIRLQCGVLGRELVDVGLDAMHACYEG